MIRLYADGCANGRIVSALRDRGVDVVTVQDDGREGRPDPAILDRAAALGRVLFSQDDDLLAEAARRQRAGEIFAGVIYAHPSVPLGVCVHDLELIAGACEPGKYRGRVEYLPL